MNRSCAKLNPSLWDKFLERREALGEPAPKPNDWTSPMVTAWLDVRSPRTTTQEPSAPSQLKGRPR